MKIGVAGGGPAGLFFAALSTDGGHQVSVSERNPRGATYGWGVVFSEGTLGELARIDPEVHRVIDDRAVRWSAIEVRVSGRVVHSTGHGFSAISRRSLLEVLQEVCTRRSVELRFEDEVEPTDPFPGADLVVAADGVRSRIRTLHRDAFRPELRPHSTRYVWYGTTLPLDAFTFVFEDTPAGLMQVHAYPFDHANSTFIVECTEEVWRGNGLDRMDEEESLSFCEKVFADVLDGHRLLSNRSEWLQFATLRCRTWHHGRVALVGDAAHTAHFSIGSGTKLAMEDAASLCRALGEHPDDLAAAFADYEAERMPAVDRFQQAALESSRYFEEVARYLHLDPVRFTYNLLTRSGRVAHSAMVQRDPALTVAASRSLAEGHAGTIVAAPPHLSPFTSRSVRIPNRVALAAPGHAPADLEALAGAGAGLCLTHEVAVSAEGRISPDSPVLDEVSVEAWRAAVDAVHRAGSLAGIVLSHAGRRAATRPRARGSDISLGDEAWPLVAASPLAFTRRGRVPAEIDEEGMTRIRQAFAEAAAHAAKSGFDLVSVDLGGGYLLGGFLSPLSNIRTDRYGGDMSNRLRFPLDVVEAVRAGWRDDRPMAVRLTVTDWHQSGISLDESVTAAVGLRQAGTDLIEVAGGGALPDAAPDYRRLYLAGHADRIKHEARVPVMARGAITTFDQIDTLVAADRADLCLLDPWRYRRTFIL
ncbi:MAG TPA: FAD-dependent monooxygenase [Acidimicrobiia bacterium]|nr:FAD-dependent monooxygenase [Acidimicrobiia bacterium]